MDDKYPECEKFAKENPKMVEIRNFMDFLSSKGLILAEYVEGREMPWPVQVNIELLLCEHFEIDPAKLEQERSAMLEDLRHG